MKIVNLKLLTNNSINPVESSKPGVKGCAALASSTRPTKI
jgi:hypothetical protein